MLFRSIFRALASGQDAWPDARERARTALRHAELQEQFYDDDTGRLTLRPLRKVLPQYLPDFPELRGPLTQVLTAGDVRQVLAPLLGDGGAELTPARPAGYAVSHS